MINVRVIAPASSNLEKYKTQFDLGEENLKKLGHS